VLSSKFRQEVIRWATCATGGAGNASLSNKKEETQLFIYKMLTKKPVVSFLFVPL